MPLIYCELPLRPIAHCQVEASNQPHLDCLALPDLRIAMNSPNVRLTRHTQEIDDARFVLSGKLADVCAALDHLAAQEQRNAWRAARR